MKRIIVCMKQALDVTQLKVDAATGQLLLAAAQRKISDFDKNALEEAVRIKEKTGETEVFTVTVAPEEVKTILREALALGADKAYVVSDPSFRDIDTSETALVLAEMIRKIGNFDLILCGETSLDGFSGLVGSKLAELLSLPQMNSVRKMTIEGESVLTERVLDDAVVTVRAKMPALISVTREINQPRIPSLMMIMKASKKEITPWSLTYLNIPKERLDPKIEILEVSAPKMERKKIRITS